MGFQTKPDDLIIPNEYGIVSREGHAYQIPTRFARESLFCILWCDEYVCVPPYKIDRSYLDAFLLFRILEGELHFAYRGKSFTASAGDIVLLDCHVHNLYWTDTSVRFQFIHFHGANSQDLCNHLYELHGALFSGHSNAARCFINAYRELYQDNPSEYLISRYLYDLLCHLAIDSRTEASQLNRDIQIYIEEHLSEPLSVDEIAAHFGMSKAYLSRKFRAETDYSPHEYLMRMRIVQACRHLENPNCSIEEIAFNCGFSNASNFIRTFRNEMGLTPAKFRRFFSSHQDSSLPK